MIWPNGVKQIPSGDSASAGERKASDRNGATVSVACLSRRRVCGASSGMKGVSSEADAALIFWFFCIKAKERGNIGWKILSKQQENYLLSSAPLNLVS